MYMCGCISNSHYDWFTGCTFRSSSFINNPHIRAKLAQLIRFIIHRDEISDSNLVRTSRNVQVREWVQIGVHCARSMVNCVICAHIEF